MKRVTAMLCLLVPLAWSQSFEAASIHVMDSAGGMSAKISGSRFNALGLTLFALIDYAWDLKPWQIVGLPSWGHDEYYDLTAKAPGDDAITQEQARLMLRSLLGERFHLKIHSETRELPVYNLIIAKGGPKLATPAPDAQPMLVAGRKGLEVTAGSMDQLANHLSLDSHIGRPVIDKTGLTGRYNYALPAWGSGASDPNSPSIFTAVQDQLGLKLESAKAPIEVWVVDSAERPGPN
jgi:uncharacterized protein (TIGR03435 family)